MSAEEDLVQQPPQALSPAANYWKSVPEEELACPICRDPVLDPRCLACCRLLVCQRCLEPPAQCPSCKLALEQEDFLRINLLDQLLDFYWGRSELAQERQRRQRRVVRQREQQQRANRYLRSQRWAALREAAFTAGRLACAQSPWFYCRVDNLLAGVQRDFPHALPQEISLLEKLLPKVFNCRGGLIFDSAGASAAPPADPTQLERYQRAFVWHELYFTDQLAAYATLANAPPEVLAALQHTEETYPNLSAARTLVACFVDSIVDQLEAAPTPSASSESSSSD